MLDPALFQKWEKRPADWSEESDQLAKETVQQDIESIFFRSTDLIELYSAFTYLFQELIKSKISRRRKIAAPNQARKGTKSLRIWSQYFFNCESKFEANNYATSNFG